MSVIQDAIDAIGHNPGGEPDYVIRPEEHADALERRANEQAGLREARTAEPVAPLLRVLRRPAYERLTDLYNMHNETAIRAQARFLFWSGVIIWGVVYAIVVGATLAVFPPSTWGPPGTWLTEREAAGLGWIALWGAGASLIVWLTLKWAPKPLRWFANSLPGVLLFLAAHLALAATILLLFPPHDWAIDRGWNGGRWEFFLVALVFLLLLLIYAASLFLGLEKIRETWLGHRGRAEQARKDLFEEVFAANDPGPRRDGELPLLPLQLEYFRRYQLEVQTAFFDQRGRDHKSDAGWARTFTVIFGVIPFAMLLLLVAFAIAPSWNEHPSPWAVQFFSAGAEFWPDTLVAKLLLLGVIVGAAITSGWQAQIMVNNSSRNARRYAKTLANLRAIENAGLAPAREAAAAGDPGPIMSFVHAVHGLMSAELQEWIELSEVDAQNRLRTTARNPGVAPGRGEAPT